MLRFTCTVLLLGFVSLPAKAQVRWHPCDDAQLKARCGTLTVPEDHSRSDANARSIQVAFAVLPATGATRVHDPLLVLLGGPGDAPLGRAADFSRQFAAINASRDIVLVDQRGTGKSSPIACFFGSDDDLQSYMNEFMPLAGVRDCLIAMRRSADLGRYRTRDFVRDLEVLRRALDVQRWNLHGSSYGTRVALQYMARHPDRIRSGVLMAPVPPELVMPVSFGEDADRAIGMLAADCRADSACAAAFPRFGEELDSVAARLQRAPATATIPHPGSGVPTRVTLSRGTFGEVMRATMYTPQGARSLPLMVHEAYEGDFSAIASAAFRRQRSMARAGWAGLYLAVTCVEDIARSDSAEAFARNRGTILTDGRARQHIGGCAGWPVRPDGDDWPGSHRVSAPVLVIVGEQDPVTPPRWAKATMRYLERGRLVVVPQGGHGFAGMEGGDCLMRIQSAFIASADPGVDVTCAAAIRRQPFILRR